MLKKRSSTILALMTFSSCMACANEAPVGSLDVWPRSAGELSPMPLSDLVFEAIPSENGITWDHLLIPNVSWTTDGIEYTETGMARRSGLARARADQTTTKILRQKWEELAWSLELSTDGNVKWGPTSLSIIPGLDGSISEGAYICFGEGFQGCAFSIEALRSPKLTLTPVCEIGSGANVSKVMDATTNDGRKGVVVYQSSGGSGGISNSIEVTTVAAKEYCAANASRGY
jgi:hypothetical protein